VIGDSHPRTRRMPAVLRGSGGRRVPAPVTPSPGAVARLLLALLPAAIFGCGDGGAPRPPAPAGVEIQSIGSFSEGLAPAQVNGKWGFIDPEGRLAVPAVYDRVTRFENGTALVLRSGLWGAVNSDGALVLQRRYLGLGSSDGTLAPASTRWGDAGFLYGYVNGSGVFVIPEQYEEASAFSGGLAVAGTGGDYSIIDTLGNATRTLPYDRAFGFSDGLAMVKDGRHKYGFVDADGQEVIAPAYDSAEPFSLGLASVENGEGLWGYVDTRGEVVIDFQYDYAGPFREDFAAVAAHGVMYYIDKSGAPAFDSSWRQAFPFSGGLALVVDPDGSSYYVDVSGRDAGVLRAHVPAPRPRDASPAPGDAIDGGFSHYLSDGLAMYTVVNFTDRSWSLVKSSFSGTAQLLPGLPSTVASGKLPTTGPYSAFAHYRYAGDEWSISLSSDAGGVILNLDNKVQAPPAQGHVSWWRVVAGAVSEFVGLAMVCSGNPAGVKMALGGVVEMAEGLSDGAGCDNAVSGQSDVLQTTITATRAGPFVPLNDFSGADAYTIGDGGTTVIEMTSVRTQLAPATVALYLYDWADFYATKAALAIKNWAADPSGKYNVPPYSMLVDAIYDTQSTAERQPNDGWPVRPCYVPAVRGWSTDDIAAFWIFCQAFDNTGQDADKDRHWADKILQSEACR